MLNRLLNRIWHYWIRRAARARGFIDPIALLSRLSQFAKPSEVSFPVEVMRIGVILQARGAVNSQAIQHNLDWVWPYWVEKQFNPKDPSFVPRAFSMTHINLTHRNWTAVGLPDCDELPIVDPRGLVTPIYDGWSIDSWIVSESGEDLIPSKADQVDQRWDIDRNIGVVTDVKNAQHRLVSEVKLQSSPEGSSCQIILKAHSKHKSWLVVSLRPYNPEGISFVNKIKILKENRGWRIDDEYCVIFKQTPQRRVFSNYKDGDVYRRLLKEDVRESVKCTVGMASAAVMFAIEADQEVNIEIDIPLQKEGEHRQEFSSAGEDQKWLDSLQGHARLQISDQKFQFLYDAAIRTLIIHSAVDVYPGPYTYKHFWFRDAVFMHYAMLCVGLTKRCERLNELFLSRQQFNGYFRSQEGEWDSNGQVLWCLRQYCELTGQKPLQQWKDKIDKAVHWISNKRLSSKDDKLHAGLMPSGFSAEHLGPNDFYYWDDFWSVEGLQSGSFFMNHYDESEKAQKCQTQADDLMRCIEQSLSKIRNDFQDSTMPSSPYRRLDSASVGSIAVGYPLQLWKAEDERLMDTVEFLLKRCFLEDGFFHDMSHSGINPYLSLYVAQVLLRAGDSRYYPIMKRVAELASSTGQWPEAIHPQTLGGCMGDGQHSWASAEWILMMRNCFVREESDCLILCGGVDSSWYEERPAKFGPAPTKWGAIEIIVTKIQDGVNVQWNGQWRQGQPNMEIKLPGFQVELIGDHQKSVDCKRLKV